MTSGPEASDPPRARPRVTAAVGSTLFVTELAARTAAPAVGVAVRRHDASVCRAQRRVLDEARWQTLDDPRFARLRRRGRCAPELPKAVVSPTLELRERFPNRRDVRAGEGPSRVDRLRLSGREHQGGQLKGPCFGGWHRPELPVVVRTYADDEARHRWPEEAALLRVAPAGRVRAG